MISKETAFIRSRTMLYFAAAVSDFYIPYADMAVDKIQSSDGIPKLPLAASPKFLGQLREEWNKEAFCVSFKLETDASILLLKARKAIAKYNMNCVCANKLDTRRNTCSLVAPSNYKGPEVEVLTLEEAQKLSNNTSVELEYILTRKLAKRHAEYIEEKKEGPIQLEPLRDQKTETYLLATK